MLRDLRGTGASGLLSYPALPCRARRAHEEDWGRVSPRLIMTYRREIRASKTIRFIFGRDFASENVTALMGIQYCTKPSSETHAYPTIKR